MADAIKEGKQATLEGHEKALEDLPPSLKCQLCSKLIERATLTPCCFSSCCFECLKSYLTSSHKLASSRAGVCPLTHCREQDVFVQDLIPNHALNKAAEWFIRQRISMMDQVTLEATTQEKPEDIDVTTIGKRLIEEAKTQAKEGDRPEALGSGVSQDDIVMADTVQAHPRVHDPSPFGDRDQGDAVKSKVEDIGVTTSHQVNIKGQPPQVAPSGAQQQSHFAAQASQQRNGGPAQPSYLSGQQPQQQRVQQLTPQQTQQMMLYFQQLQQSQQLQQNPQLRLQQQQQMQAYLALIQQQQHQQQRKQ